MIPATQASHNGCLPACIASILECEVADLPSFIEHDWYAGWNRALEPLGWWLLSIAVSSRPDDSPPAGYWIAVVPSLNVGRDKHHAVVAHGAELAWDPARGKRYDALSLDDVRTALFLFPLDPACVATHARGKAAA